MADPAAAAPTRIRFQIAPKAYSEALLDLAQQANITLIGAAACDGSLSHGLSGAYDLEQALGRLLEGAPCNWRVRAPGAVEITPLVAVRTPPPPVTVSELLVTATKRVRNPRQLAVAVTAIPREQLQATASADAGEASGQLAGVLATNLGPGRNKLLLRGLSDGAYTGRARSTVATYLDDLPVNYNAPDPDFRLVDVERVEVARGPQGALYGSGSLSGIYRIVTRRPDLGRFGAELRGSIASTYDGAESNALEGYVNLPVWRDVAGLRIAAYQEVRGGYLDDILQLRTNVDRTERKGARVALLFQPSDTWSVNLTATGQHLRSDDTHYTTPGLGLRRSVRIPEPHVNDIATVAGTIRRSWSGVELTSSTGFVRHAYGSLYDATATQENYTAFAQTSAYSERTRTRMVVQDLVLTSRGARKFDWLAGLYASDTSTDSPTEFLAQVPRAPNVLVYGDDRHDHIREVAAYGELSWALDPLWTVALGGRVFDIHERTRSRVVSERFAPRNIDDTADFSGFSPKLSVQRTLGGGNLVYVVLSEGYRAGGINSGGARPLPPERETFSPDRLRNLELGLKLEQPARGLSLNASAFYDYWKDIQTDQFRDSGIPFTTNVGNAQILGVEGELSWNAGGGFTAQLNGRLSHTRSSDAPVAFDTLPGAPAVSAGALLTYERALRGDWIMRLVGETTYLGRSRVTFDASAPEMGDYTRTKLLAELSSRNLGLQVFVTNPTNAFSDTFAFGNPFNPNRTRQITPQLPRTFGVTLFAAY